MQMITERNTRNVILFAIALAACAIALALLAGCGGSGAQQSSSSSSASASSSGASSESSESSEPAVMTVGDKADGAVSLMVVNALGAPITDIAFLPAGDEGDPHFLMQDGQQIVQDEKAVVFFAPAGDGANYDVRVKAGEAAYTLHNLDLKGVEELTVRIEGDVAYADFVRDGQAISSLSDEMARIEAEQQQQQEEETTYYEEPSYTYDAPAQGEQGCVEGGVQLR